jgi:hypothetical protein
MLGSQDHFKDCIAMEEENYNGSSDSTKYIHSLSNIKFLVNATFLYKQ